MVTGDLDDGLGSDADRALAPVALVGDLDDAEEIRRDIRANASTQEDQTAFITVIRDLDGQALLWTQGV